MNLSAVGVIGRKDILSPHPGLEVEGGRKPTAHAVGYDLSRLPALASNDAGSLAQMTALAVGPPGRRLEMGGLRFLQICRADGACPDMIGISLRTASFHENVEEPGFLCLRHLRKATGRGCGRNGSDCWTTPGR